MNARDDWWCQASESTYAARGARGFLSGGLRGAGDEGDLLHGVDDYREDGASINADDCAAVRVSWKAARAGGARHQPYLYLEQEDEKNTCAGVKRWPRRWRS